MGALLGLILIILLFAFFGLEGFVVNYFNAADVRILGISLLSNGFRGFIGLAIVFCEIGIILYSMLDKVGDAIRDVIKPLLRLLPLGAFLSTSYDTFSPLVLSVLPAEVAAAIGEPSYENLNFAQVVNTPAFSEGILLTLFTMGLFVFTSKTLSETRDSAQVRELRAEIKRYRKELQRGL